MKTIQIILPLLFLYANSYAQNWKTIQLQDTTYFTVVCPVGIDSDMNGYLRCVWIDSVKVAGSDSLFHFNKTVVDTQLQICAHTDGNTFLGNKIIRNNITGVETYFNLNMLPIEIRTFAQLNDSWNMITDTSGKEYHATVTNVYQIVIDGVLDSVKDISIQAFSNGVPVYSVFNNAIITLSKEHGFFNTLHLNIFPACFNNIGYVSGYLQPEIVSNHRRVESSLKSVNFAERDLTFQYKVGNEWIFESSIGIGNYLNMYNDYKADIFTDHDSIISTSPINANALAYTFQRKRHLWHYLHQGNVDSNVTYNTTSIITDTVYNSNAFVSLQTKVCSDIFDVTLDTATAPENSMRAVYYFLDSVCGNPRLTRFDYGSKYSSKNNADSCHKFSFSISGFTKVDTSTLRNYDFKVGSIVSYNYGNMLSFNNYYKLLYLKTDSCTYQNKFNVFTLSLNEQSVAENEISVFPIPSSDVIKIKNNGQQIKIIKIILYNAIGQEIYEAPFTTSDINVSQFQAGIYYLIINTDRRNIRKKIVIN